MEILILGGTGFLGGHVVECATARGHAVTLLNRGKTAPGRFPSVETVVVSDRDGGMAAVSDRHFDVVVDTCGYVPRVVQQAVDHLAGRAAQYLFVSSVSAYADHRPSGIREDHPLAAPPELGAENVTGETYGGLKVACERTVQDGFGEGALVVRPGLIVGPGDHTDRFTWWVATMATRDRVLVPGPREAPIQVIDARDLADWMVRLVEDEVVGVFNAVGDPGRHTMAELVTACAAAAGRPPAVEWVDSSWLLARGVEPWSEIPLWLPDEKHAGMMQVDNSAALATGMKLRPLLETIADTLRWHRGRGKVEWKAGLTDQRIDELLLEWAATGSARQ